MRLELYIFLLFGLALSGYLLGQTNLFDAMSNTYGAPEDMEFIILLVLGAFTALTIAGAVIGFTAVYAIPATVLLAILNFFVFPFSFLVDSTVPEIIAIPTVILYNILAVLAVLNFVRGSA